MFRQIIQNARWVTITCKGWRTTNMLIMYHCPLIRSIDPSSKWGHYVCMAEIAAYLPNSLLKGNRNAINEQNAAMQNVHLVQFWMNYEHLWTQPGSFCLRNDLSIIQLKDNPVLMAWWIRWCSWYGGRFPTSDPSLWCRICEPSKKWCLPATFEPKLGFRQTLCGNRHTSSRRVASEEEMSIWQCQSDEHSAIPPKIAESSCIFICHHHCLLHGFLWIYHKASFHAGTCWDHVKDTCFDLQIPVGVNLLIEKPGRLAETPQLPISLHEIKSKQISLYCWIPLDLIIDLSCCKLKFHAKHRMSFTVSRYLQFLVVETSQDQEKQPCNNKNYLCRYWEVFRAINIDRISQTFLWAFDRK